VAECCYVKHWRPFCPALRRAGTAPAFAAAPHEWECDFVTATAAIQCCARLTPENRARELRGLLEAAALAGAAKGKAREMFVITLDQEDTLVEQGQSVRIIPGWKWLD
jgi:predicted AAA+ superfamily ATPase